MVKSKSFRSHSKSKTRKSITLKSKTRKSKTRENKISTSKKGLKTHNTYTKDDFNSNDGMLTSVWGPALWHYLHVMSFNYPVKPSIEDKRAYKNFILNLQCVLPCKYCRNNLKNNLKALPLTSKALKNRNTFSKWLYQLHEKVNAMLGKKSGLSFSDVRERYEHFRSRCTIQSKNNKSKNKTRKRKEKGCTKALYGKPSQCIVKIVPKNTTRKTFQMDKKCIKKRLT